MRPVLLSSAMLAVSFSASLAIAAPVPLEQLERRASDESALTVSREIPTRPEAGHCARGERSTSLDVRAIDAKARARYESTRASHPELPPSTNLEPLVIEWKHGVWWVIYRQTQDGLPIEGTRADFRFDGSGNLLFSSFELIPETNDRTAPMLALADAREAAEEALHDDGVEAAQLRSTADLPPFVSRRDEPTSFVAAGPDRTDHLAWIPWQGEARLVYRVRTELSDPPARFVSTIDAESGELISRENEYLYADFSGHAEGEIQLVVPTDPFVTRAFEDLRVSVAGLGSTFSDEAGNWAISAVDGFPRQVTSALTGRYVKVNDTAGPEPSFTAQATPGTPLTIHWNDLNSEPSERDAFYHTNIVHDWIKAIDPSFTALDYEMPVNVNLNQTCNAFWDGSGTNFFHAGGGCPNTAQIPDVVYHEYGHGDVQFCFAPVFATSAEHEGFADYHACSLTNQPHMGRGMNGAGTFIRDLDNDLQFPAPECNNEGHCVGKVIGGALWHMRENLTLHLGPVAGPELADRLFHDALSGRSTTFEGYLYDLLAVDDDNGTLLDGTPHSIEILPAFRRHNLGPGYVLQIVHQAHRDTDQANVALPIRAVFDCPADLVIDSLAVYYSSGPVGGNPTHGPDRLAMLPTGSIREYQAVIPGQPLGTEVRYWVSGLADTLGLSDTSPDNAPAQQHVFRVELDGTAPTLQHDPIFDRARATFPIEVEAHAQDNQTLAAVTVEWKRNGVDQPAFALAHVGDGDLYRGSWSGAVSENDLILYRIKAIDSAQIPNVAYNPSSGYNSFHVTHVWRNDAEHGVQDLTHVAPTENYVDQWNLSTQRSKAGTHSWKFGDTGDDPYADYADGALLVPSMTLGSGAYFKLFFWIQAEEDTGDRAWDAGLIEITTNGGQSWSLLEPLGGYTHTLMPSSQNPLPPLSPCWSGSQGWIQAMFDLASFAGQTTQIRCRFGSDGFVGLIGWYVDELVLDPGIVTTDVAAGTLPTRTELLSPSPNPFGTTAQLRFALARPEKTELEIVDVGGRRVRSLIDAEVSAGSHVVEWNGRNDDGYPSGAGVYFVRLRAGDQAFSRKLLRIR